MVKKGGLPEAKITPLTGDIIEKHPSKLSQIATGQSYITVEKRRGLVAHILNADQTIDFIKLISLLHGDEIVSFLEEQNEKGNSSAFFDFFDFLKQDFFGENNAISEEIVSLIRNNSILKGHIVLYIKERNHRVLSEQNMKQCEIISFHLFLLGMNQDFDLAQDIRVKKFAHTESLFSQYSLEIGKILGKLQLNAWGRSMDILNLKLDLYIELCETIIKLGVIHSVNLEERKIAFDLSSIIKGGTGVIFDELRKNLPQNSKIDILEHTIGRSMVNFARGGVIIDGKTREEIKKQVIAIKKEQKAGFDMMVSSQFGGDPSKEKIFCTVFLGEGTCAELIGLEKIEKIYGELNSEEEQRKSELLDNLLSIYNSGIDADIESSASAIDAFVTKDHLENEYQIETIYHIVCFDKTLDEMILGPLLYFLVTKKEFPNALYEQFSIKIIEQIIKILTKSGAEKIPEVQGLIDQTFLYLQSKNSSNFILGHSRIYLALAYYYLGLPDNTPISLAQKAFLHYTNLSSVNDGERMQVHEKERQFYTLLGDRGLKNLGISTVLSTGEKEKIGQKLYRDFSEGYEVGAINTIKTEVLRLISDLNTGDDVYSAKEINELISQEVAEKLFDNLCTISIIGECKNCIHQGHGGEIFSCSDNKAQCRSRKMKKGFQAEYIDMSNGLSIQFSYPVVSARIFDQMFAQKREMIKDHFENLIASNTKNEKLTRLAFYDTDTSLPNRNKLEEDILGKERTMAFLEVADYSTILGLHGGRENWLQLTKQIAEHFTRLSGITAYRYNEKVFCLVFSPESIERIMKKGNASHVGKIIANIIDGIVFEFSATYNRSIQFHTGIIAGQKERLTEYAHIALTESKNPRHHGPYIFQEGDEKKPEQTHYYTNILENALDDNDKEHSIIPHYQRIYDPRNPHRKNIEALARMEIPSDTGAKQLVGAHNFIGIATNKKWLSRITRKMIEQIIEDMKQDPDLEVSINIHEQDWNDEGIMAWFRWIHENSGIETKRITIEILENVPLDKWDDLDADNKRIDGKDKKQVQELRDLGYKIAIDDYGAHGGSAEKIKKLKPDKIKLDRSVVEGLKYQEDKKESIAIIRHTVNMAREIGAEVIAEYVENKEIYEILLELGVDYFQGWYFAKAVPLDEVEWGELKAA